MLRQGLIQSLPGFILQGGTTPALYARQLLIRGNTVGQAMCEDVLQIAA